MRSNLYKPPSTDNSNAICIADGRETMGNNNGSPLMTVHQLIQSRLDDTFRIRVERRGGFIEKEDFRIFHESARYCYSLFLVEHGKEMSFDVDIRQP